MRMRNYSRRIPALFLAVVFCFLCGCTEIADRNLPETTPPETTTVSPDVTDAPEETSDISVSQTTAPVTAEPIEEEYLDYEFSVEDEEFIADCVFVGDSICKGLSHYGIVPVDNTFALGGVAARNIFEYTFEVDGDELELLTALVNAGKGNIVFSMGMNDINMTSKIAFARNYKDLLEQVEAACPVASIYVIGITPIASTSDFSTNDIIDEYNEALRLMVEESGKINWFYVDPDSELKNSQGYLKTNYESGDGLHLAMSAYYGILWKLCQKANE